MESVDKQLIKNRESNTFGVVTRVFFPSPDKFPYHAVIECKLDSGKRAAYLESEVRCLAVIIDS